MNFHKYYFSKKISSPIFISALPETFSISKAPSKILNRLNLSA